MNSRALSAAFLSVTIRSHMIVTEMMENTVSTLSTGQPLIIMSRSVKPPIGKASVT